MFAVMQVLKFGGAPLRNADGFRHMVAILNNEASALVVVSALGSTTRDLEACCQMAVSGNLQGAQDTLKCIFIRHLDIVNEVTSERYSSSADLPGLYDAERELERILTSVSVTKQCTPKTRDRVLSFGERLALFVVIRVLARASIDAVGISARQIMVTTASHGNAFPIESKIQVHVDRDVKPLFQKHKFVVTEGFVGATEQGHLTTMGKESSNLTATLLGSLLDARRVTIYTDVEGVRSADPDICEPTDLRPGFTFADAKRAAKHGLKLLYPSMIEPAERVGIPICIAAVHNATGDITTIQGTAPPSKPIVSVHDGNDENTKRVSVVFCTIEEWTVAAAGAAKSIKDFDSCYVSSDPTDTSVTFLCSASIAPELARYLHKALVTTSEAEYK